MFPDQLTASRIGKKTTPVDAAQSAGRDAIHTCIHLHILYLSSLMLQY